MNRYKLIGKTIAELVHYTMAWEEPLTSDEIDPIVRAFKEELKELNGED